MKVIVRKPVEHILVAVIGRISDRTLSQIIGYLIREISVPGRVIVIATHALREPLGRDVFPFPFANPMIRFGNVPNPGN